MKLSFHFRFGMSMCVLGMHEELRPDGIAVNALWPKTGKERERKRERGREGNEGREMPL